MDGSIAYTINAHEELCAINKPGNVSLLPAEVLFGVQLAVTRAKYLHTVLEKALIALQVESDKMLEAQTLLLQKRNQEMLQQQQVEYHGSAATTSNNNGSSYGDKESSGGGLSKNDPLLSWSLLHRPAGLPPSVAPQDANS